MQKTILILVISSLLVSLAFTADSTCKDQPAYVKAKGLINDVLKGDSKGAEKVQLLLKAYEESSGEVLSNEDLGVCSQYSGQKTCCTKQLIKLIDRAALLKIKPLQKQQNAFHKFFNIYSKQLTKQNCVGTTVATSEQMFQDTTLANLKSIRDTQNQCKIDFGKAIADLTRGAMCSICAGVDKISSYFDSDGKLIISADSQKAFQDAATTAITCIANAISQDNLGKVVDDLNGKYAKAGDACQATVKTKCLSQFANPKVSNSDGNGGNKCNGKNIFTPSSDCENSTGGDSSLNDITPDPAARLLRTEYEGIYRMLATEDATVGAGGVNILVTSSSDSTVDSTGDFNVTFDDIDSNSLKLAFGAIVLGLFAFLL